VNYTLETEFNLLFLVARISPFLGGFLVEDDTVIITAGNPVIPREWGRQIDILPFSRGDGDSMIGITAVMGIEILLLPL